jgi:hypothetical protein
MMRKNEKKTKRERERGHKTKMIVMMISLSRTLSFVFFSSFLSLSMYKYECDGRMRRLSGHLYTY